MAVATPPPPPPPPLPSLPAPAGGDAAARLVSQVGRWASAGALSSLLTPTPAAAAARHTGAAARGAAGSSSGGGSGGGNEEEEDERDALQSLLARDFYRQQLFAVMYASEESAHYGVFIRMEDLVHACPALASDIALHSQDVLLTLEHALRAAQNRLLSGPTPLPERDQLTPKFYVHARIGHLYSLPGFTRPNISAIRSSDMGCFVQVSGTVIRTGSVRMVERIRFFQCTSAKCRFEFPVYIEVEHDNTMTLPCVCPNPALPNGKRCTCTTFKPVEGRTVKADYQEVKVQEQVQSLSVGCIPRSIVVVLEHDLVDTCKAGDDVVITGTVIHRWGRVSRGARCDLDLLIRANHVRICSARGVGGVLTDQLVDDFKDFWDYYAASPLAGRNVIVQSMCPQLHGLFLVKLAVMLVLIGGVGQVHANGTKTRGEPHMLLIGDPGVGKSQFLRYAAKLIPRSVLTTGIGSTSAGLTCTAVKDGGEWMLEAGALVLADRGICCIDEFSSIRDGDRTTIHEAMEQQTLSVAKAGLVCKLNARCTIIAATNPKGKYDTSMDVSANTAIASPLLSRFDLILVLLDTNNGEWDRTVSSFILSAACARGAALMKSVPAAMRPASAGGEGVRTTSASTHSSPAVGTEAAHLARASKPVTELGLETGAATRMPDGRRVEANPDAIVRWGLERLQAYIAHVKSALQPGLSKSAQEVLMRYYELQRRTDSRSAARTTLRLLESLVRLAQAHARLMWRTEAGVQDAVMAVVLVETSMHTSAMLGVSSVLHSQCPTDPDAEYALQQSLVLRRLGLQHLDVQTPGGGGSSQDSGSAAALPRTSAAFHSQRAAAAQPAAAASFALESMFGGVLPAEAATPPPAQYGSRSGGNAQPFAGGGASHRMSSLHEPRSVNAMPRTSAHAVQEAGGFCAVSRPLPPERVPLFMPSQPAAVDARMASARDVGGAAAAQPASVPARDGSAAAVPARVADRASEQAASDARAINMTLSGRSVRQAATPPGSEMSRRTEVPPTHDADDMLDVVLTGRHARAAFEGVSQPATPNAPLRMLPLDVDASQASVHASVQRGSAQGHRSSAGAPLMRPPSSLFATASVNGGQAAPLHPTPANGSGSGDSSGCVSSADGAVASSLAMFDSPGDNRTHLAAPPPPAAAAPLHGPSASAVHARSEQQRSAPAPLPAPPRQRLQPPVLFATPDTSQGSAPVSQAYVEARAVVPPPMVSAQAPPPAFHPVQSPPTAPRQPAPLASSMAPTAVGAGRAAAVPASTTAPLVAPSAAPRTEPDDDGTSHDVLEFE